MTAIIKKDGTYWEPSEDQIIEWQRAYKSIDVHRELDAIACWCEANPAKRKVQMARFVNAWLQRTDKTGGKSPFAKESKPGEFMKTREMSSLDDLSHNFLGCPIIRAHFIEKFGQSFENGERITG